MSRSTQPGTPPERTICLSSFRTPEAAAAVVDAQGHFTPTVSNLVTFSVTGPGRIVGVGNGDPSDHSPDKASQRHAFNGHCLVDVQADRPGKIVVTASAPGLARATFVLQAVAGQFSEAPSS